MSASNAKILAAVTKNAFILVPHDPSFIRDVGIIMALQRRAGSCTTNYMKKGWKVDCTHHKQQYYNKANTDYHSTNICWVLYLLIHCVFTFELAYEFASMFLVLCTEKYLDMEKGRVTGFREVVKTTTRKVAREIKSKQKYQSPYRPLAFPTCLTPPTPFPTPPKNSNYTKASHRIIGVERDPCRTSSPNPC